MPSEKRRVLIIGGGFSGLLAARDLASNFEVTLVDAKEYFEYTPGVLRAFVHPEHFDALSFTYQSVLERKMGVKFLWGEVKDLDVERRIACIKPMFSKNTEDVPFDYCVVAAGCNFGVFHKWGESLWFPTVHEDARPEGSWSHIDERFIEGRRRHILEEREKLSALNKKRAKILVVGAGFIGVEWATELQHYFPNMTITIIDFLPKCLGPLPESAASYCDNYMKENGINRYYGIKYAPNEPGFFEKIGFSTPPDATYVCVGVKASSYFMPKDCLSGYNPLEADKREKDPKKCGPGGGGWIRVNKKLQVLRKDAQGNDQVVAGGRIFAVGDCNMVMDVAPIPKISYPSEEQAQHVCHNIAVIDNIEHNGKSVGGCFGFGGTKNLKDTWWPWGAGMFATSLGPDDACFVTNAKSTPGTGILTLWGKASAVQKELIESTKVDECKYGLIGRMGWHFVHHTPFYN
jgi:apoptosis-inducing factor 2